MPFQSVFKLLNDELKFNYEKWITNLKIQLFYR